MAERILQLSVDGIDVLVRAYEEGVPAEVPEEWLGPTMRIVRRGGYWFVFHWPQPWCELIERFAAELSHA